MNATGCFGTLDSMLSDTTHNKEKIKRICSQIDAFISRFSGYGYEININHSTNDIEIFIIFEEFEIDDCSDEFYEVIQESKSMDLLFVDFEHLKLKIVFSGILED